MLWFNKLFCLIFALIIAVAEIALADSDSIFFDWKPFVANNAGDVNSNKKNLLKSSIYYREISKKFNYQEELFSNNFKFSNNSPGKSSGKSILSKIKVSFSTISSFMLPYDEIHTRGYEGRLSRAAGALPSLLTNPSQEITIETLKLIEPQVNLGFEF